MSDSNVITEILEDRILITQVPPSGRKSNADIVEVGFKDGNDNPQITSEAGLLAERLHYKVDAGPEYKFIHSADPGFREYADQLQEFKSEEIDKNSPEEKYMSNGEIEIAGIVMDVTDVDLTKVAKQGFKAKAAKKK